jgi:hypothetical protein
MVSPQETLLWAMSGYRVPDQRKACRLAVSETCKPQAATGSMCCMEVNTAKTQEDPACYTAHSCRPSNITPASPT